jgi:hypothetical protein
MAGHYAIFPRHHLIYSCVTGRVSSDEMIALRTRTMVDTDFDPTFDVIVDLRHADLGAWSRTDIAIMASATVLEQSARRVLIADSADKFGLARMYQIRRDIAGGQERIFVASTMAEGLTWLGLDGFDPSLEMRGTENGR